MSEEKKYTVFTQNPSFSGIRLGIAFVSGRASVRRSTALLLCERFGYTCPELQGKAAEVGDNHQPEPVEVPPAEAPQPVEQVEAQGQDAPAKAKGKRKKGK